MNGSPLRASKPPIVMLFMVPLQAAATRPGMACDSAPSTTSTMRCEVSTLPPATALGKAQCTTVPSSATMRTGTMQPWLKGNCCSARVRMQ